MKLSQIRATGHSTLLVECFLLLSEGSPNWPQELSDDLFVPPRIFEKRRRARSFLRWLESVGIDVSRWREGLEENVPVEPPPILGAGGVGRAYDFGDKVVKFTTDKKEVRAAFLLAGQQVHFAARVYGVVQISGTSLFAIVLDKLPVKLPAKYRTAANAVWDYMDAFDRPIGDVDRAAQDVIGRFLDRRHRSDPVILSGIRKILFAVDKIYRQTGILLQDPHGGNVLLDKSGNVGLFDFGRSRSPAVAAAVPAI